jgi:hypothetical protein
MFNVIYNSEIPVKVNLVEFNSMSCFNDSDVEKANEWLAKRFGMTPLILYYEKCFITHPANEKLMEDLL